MEKICTKCEALKDFDSFCKRKKAADGRASWCRDCYRANWQKRYYENHELYRAKHNRSRNEIREQNARQVFEYLEKHCCINCGESDSIVLEFDHRNRNEKFENISNLIFNCSWKRIKFEIEKCDVLCANCHRRKSATQFNYKRHIFVNS